MMALAFERLSDHQFRSLATLSEDVYHCNLDRLPCSWQETPVELDCMYTVPQHTHTTLMIQLATAKSSLKWDLQIHLQPHSQLTIQWIDEQKSMQSLNLTTHFHVGEKACVKSFMVLNPHASRVICEHYMLKKQSSLEIFALVFQTQDVLLHYSPAVLHQEKETHTDIKVRTLLAGNSDTALCGRLTLLPQASASAHYQNHNLIIGGSPKLLAQPELEIAFDQVQCTHGVTLGRLDLQALFYMQSRGLSSSEAKTLLMRSFMLKETHPLLTHYTFFIDTLLNKLF